MRPGELRAYTDQVKANIDIAEIIGARVELNSSMKGLCPFHKERYPSFSVNTRGQYFHCFGCGAGGDVIKFLMLYEQAGFVKALVDLAEYAGIDVPKSLRGK